MNHQLTFQANGDFYVAKANPAFYADFTEVRRALLEVARCWNELGDSAMSSHNAFHASALMIDCIALDQLVDLFAL